KGDVRNGSDDLGHAAMRFEPDPLDPVGTGLKTADVNPEVRDMMLLSTRLRVWNPDVVVPPSELRCHGRRLMVQSLSASHASLHRSHLTDYENLVRRACRTLMATDWSRDGRYVICQTDG